MSNINDAPADDLDSFVERPGDASKHTLYILMEQDTGTRRHFEVPLGQGRDHLPKVMQQVAGLERIARCPSMSASPGKGEIQGATEVASE